ncbi:MAG: ABC transporter substrate-binding protein [Desulfovibrio sp.]|jgi:ABC-type Fe3+ transport system substrate-binding protein|nr:ABC transporter substrate-binding protein [Desulfovibrio sp.]
MSCTLHLAMPPNILRRVREDVARLWPDTRLGMPSTHEEMNAFASRFGDGPLPSLTVTAYPQIALRLPDLARQGRLARPDPDLPPLREEYGRIGLAAPAEEARIVAVAAGVLAAETSLAPRLKDWADLCAPDFPGPVGCPPRDTPLPYLAEAVLRKAAGEGAEHLLSRLDTASNPLDINKRLGRGELKAALIIPAFARTFREGGAGMIWPASGALALPLLACLDAQAPPEAHEILAYLLSEEFQRAVVVEGVIAPVRAGVAGFAELEENGWNLFWPGWDLLFDVARTMLEAVRAGKA